MSRSMTSLVNRLRCGARAGVALVCTLWMSGLLFAQGQPPGQDGFVAVSDSPGQEQLPAAPLLIAAYIFVLAALFAYVVSLAKRLSSVQRDVQRLEDDVKRRGRA
jgi:hypothetical protein